MSATLLALEAQFNLRERASQLSFGTITTQLSELIRHVDNIGAQLCMSTQGPEVPEGRSGADVPTPEAVRQVVRVVQHAVQQYVSRGRLKSDLVVLDCPDIRNLPVKGRRIYARQLTFLRLFIWLLQHAMVSHELWRAISCGEESLIGRHARLSFAWQFSTSLGNLDTALRGPMASDLPFLPDLRYKPWVQYLLDRVGQGLVPVDGASSSKELLSLIDKFWDHWPAPSQGLNIYFVAPIDKSVKSAKCRCDLCKFMTNRDADIELHERLDSAKLAMLPTRSELPQPCLARLATLEHRQQTWAVSLPQTVQVLEYMKTLDRQDAPEALQEEADPLRKRPKLAATASNAADHHEAPHNIGALSPVTPQKRKLVHRQTVDTRKERASAKAAVPRIVKSTCASRGFL